MMSDNQTHYGPGVKKNPRPTTFIGVKDNKLSKDKVDGEVKAHPQPK